MPPVVPNTSEPVRRALARDDLLLLAQDAEKAVGIVRARENLRFARRVTTPTTLFEVALERHLAAATEPKNPPAARATAYYQAGAIVDFCRQLDYPLDAPEDSAALFQRAIDLGGPHEPGQVSADLTMEVFTTYRQIRALRLRGQYGEAIDLAGKPPRWFNGTGAQPRIAYFQYELGAALLSDGQARQIDGALGEDAEEVWNGERARRFVTGHRFGLIRGLGSWETGDDDAAARLGGARKHLLETAGDDLAEYAVHRLSLTLAQAEQFVASGAPGFAQAAVGLAEEALEIAEDIRGRWGVIVRSQTPLALVFRRLYGDIALLVSTLDTPAAAGVGLRVALSAKQTGFAARMRTGRALMSEHVQLLIDEIVDTEGAEQSSEDDEGLDRLKEELVDAVSPMLADTVLPPPTDIDDVLDDVAQRYALDYVVLPDMLERENWFRTLIEPDRTVRFGNFEPGVHFTTFLAEVAVDEATAGQAAVGAGEVELSPEGWLGRLWSPIRPDPDWNGLAVDLLPATVLDHLRSARSEDALELLISAHSSLSLLPWAALAIDTAGTRLVERAVIAQTPVLTCLSGGAVPAMTGPALVRLVADGITVTDERTAWGLDAEEAEVPLCGLELTGTASDADVAGTLEAELRQDPVRWGLVHVASHGDGAGLDQHLLLPERLTAGQALGLHWPVSVVMASCHVGRLVNVVDAEPLTFVMAALVGGSRCVVAAMDAVLDSAAGSLSAGLVTQARTGGVRLDVALRRAQLPLIRKPVVSWALFSAYVR